MSAEPFPTYPCGCFIRRGVANLNIEYGRKLARVDRNAEMNRLRILLLECVEVCEASADVTRYGFGIHHRESALRRGRVIHDDRLWGQCRESECESRAILLVIRHELSLMVREFLDFVLDRNALEMNAVDRGSEFGDRCHDS